MTIVYNKQFKLGDRVRVTEAYGSVKTGMKGRVVEVSNNNSAVEFDKRFAGGHGAGGNGKIGYCYYVTREYLEKISTNVWTGKKR